MTINILSPEQLKLLEEINTENLAAVREARPDLDAETQEEEAMRGALDQLFEELEFDASIEALD